MSHSSRAARRSVNRGRTDCPRAGDRQFRRERSRSNDQSRVLRCRGLAGCRDSPTKPPSTKPAVVAKVAPSPSSGPATTATPVPKSTPSPKSSPQPTPSVAAHPLITDWVQSDGLFTYVRVRNRGGEGGDGFRRAGRRLQRGCGRVRSLCPQRHRRPGRSRRRCDGSVCESVNDAAFSYHFDVRSGA